MKTVEEIKKELEAYKFNLHQLKCFYERSFSINATCKIIVYENLIAVLKWVLEGENNESK